MRQKKSNLIYYIIGLAVAAAVVFVVIFDVPLKTEHVEQPLDNSFINK